MARMNSLYYFIKFDILIENKYGIQRILKNIE
jgi:hypothetical protein